MSIIIFNFIRTLTAWNFGEWEAPNQKIAVALPITGPWDTNEQCQAQDKHTQYASGRILMDSHIAYTDRR
jgi:hypothetical protein